MSWLSVNWRPNWPILMFIGLYTFGFSNVVISPSALNNKSCLFGSFIFILFIFHINNVSNGKKNLYFPLMYSRMQNYKSCLGFIHSISQTYYNQSRKWITRNSYNYANYHCAFLIVLNSRFQYIFKLSNST